MEQRWVSVDDIAGYLGVSRETVYRWIEGKGLRRRRIGKFWEFEHEAVDEWVRRGSARSVHRDGDTKGDE